MRITLGEILQWDILKDARVVTDSFDPATVVENITIMEAPDIGKWIDGNNILLTGLYAVDGDKEKMAEFIDSLHSGKVRALFVKVRRFVDSVPEDIVRVCRELGIALVEIPGSIRYIDIMYPVIAAISESRAAQLSYRKQTLLENRFKREIVEDIRENRNHDSLQARLTGINISGSAHYNVFLLKMPEAGRRRAGQNSAWVHDLFIAAKNKMGLRGFESYSDDVLTALFERPFAPRSGAAGLNPAQSSPAQRHCADILKRLSLHILERAKSVLPELPLSIGYTSSFAPITQASGLHKNALDALHVSRMVYGENSFCNYDGLGICKLLCLARDRGELETCIPAAVTRLQAYQRESGLPLLETLGSYFANNGNIQRTAQALSIHHKTMSYRLRKIESVAGVDLKNSAEALEMHMGLHILRVLGASSPAI